MREFSVYTTGITAFVEDYRRAIAVNAPRPITMTVSKGLGQSETLTVPAHFPYVRVPIKHLDDTTLTRGFRISHDWDVGDAAGAFPPETEGATTSVLHTVIKFLNFHEVILPESASPAKIDDTPLPNDKNETSVHWLASMNSLGTTATKIDPRHVVKDPVDVAAYVRFPHGTISTAFVTQFKCVSVSALDGKLAGTLNRRVAQLLVCKMQVPDTEFKVEFRNYAGNPGENFKITFKAREPDPWMVFACTSLDDAFQLPTVEETFGTDTHFRLVYGLAGESVTDANVALPKSINPSPNGEKAKPLGTPRCIPPGFSGGSTGGQ